MNKNEKRTTAEFLYVLGVLILLVVLTSVFDTTTSYGGDVIHMSPVQFLMLN